MSEEEAGVAQEAAPPEEPQEPQGGSESVPKPEEMSDEAKKTYEGKSPEELAQMHYGLSRKLGEQGQVIGSLKELVEELRAGREKQTAPPNPFQSAYEQPKEVAPPVSHEEKLSDDDYLTYGKVKELLSQKEQQQQQLKTYELTQKTSLAFDEGQKSMKSNKRLFEGIEKDVAQRVAQSYMYPFKMFGVDVSGELRNPERWKQAAIQIRAEREEYDRIVPSGTTPMAATHTETPSSVRPSPSESPPIEIDMADRDMIAFADAIEAETGKRPTRKEIEETVKRGGQVWHGDVSMSDINRENR